MNYTQNYKMNLPEETDEIDIYKLDDNFDKIDTLVKDIEDELYTTVSVDTEIYAAMCRKMLDYGEGSILPIRIREKSTNHDVEAVVIQQFYTLQSQTKITERMVLGVGGSMVPIFEGKIAVVKWCSDGMYSATLTASKADNISVSQPNPQAFTLSECQKISREVNEKWHKI